MDSIRDSSLEAGLAALRCGDYPTAIAYLETVCQTQVNQSAQVRAQMALVVACDRTGEVSRAIALCQTLSQNSNTQVREWATRHEAELKNRYKALTPQPISPQSFQWRQAGRAKRRQDLPKVNLIPLWLLQAGTAIALFWLIRELLKFAMGFTNALLVKLPYLEPIQLFYRNPTQFLLVTLGILVSLSPWLLDALLRLYYGLQPLSKDTLGGRSPEAIQVLERYCRQRGWSLPQLGILPTSAPVALTYGNLPRTARIVISQGLLEQLASDEIATMYASCLGNIAHCDFIVMSLVIVVTQVPYIVYWQVSQWGDKLSNQILRGSAAVVATLAYLIWCLLSGSALWLSQLRIYYSDRFAAEITGNPNGLTRALLKTAIGISSDIQQQGHTSWLLESFNLLTSVGYRQSLTLGSLYPYTQLETVLAWDYLNPYRHWLIINNTHPLMGDRLQCLMQIARHWHLETELNLNSGKLSANRYSPKSFWLQGAPFFGIPLGFAFGVFTWLLGSIGILLGITQLAWMYGDWTIIKGCLPIGFSIGTLVRINSFFPDIKPSTAQTEPNLSHLLANPTALPVDSQPVHLQGKLLGRRGISNWLGQDLILHSPTGLIKLHYVSSLGLLGNVLFSQALRPWDLVGRRITATGWFRRGATPWLDIEMLRPGQTSYTSHPVWSTLLASAAAVWGAYIIWQGVA